MNPVCNRPTYFVIVGIKVKEIKLINPSIILSSPVFQKKVPNHLEDFTKRKLYSSSKYHLFNKKL